MTTHTRRYLTWIHFKNHVYRTHQIHIYHLTVNNQHYPIITTLERRASYKASAHRGSQLIKESSQRLKLAIKNDNEDEAAQAFSVQASSSKTEIGSQQGHHELKQGQKTSKQARRRAPRGRTFSEPPRTPSGCPRPCALQRPVSTFSYWRERVKDLWPQRYF